jgi:multidomain signaling protein FimX
VQEGILVDANPAWLELFGTVSAEAIVGLPLMDAFDPESHSALKGGLVACMQGRWADHLLRAEAKLSDGSTLAVDMRLSRGEHEGEPCVLLVIAAGRADSRGLEDQLADAVQRDPATGFPAPALLPRPAAPAHGRAAAGRGALPGLHRAGQVRRDPGELGVLVGEDLLVEFARVLREQLQAGDLAGRFAGNGFMVLIERGNLRDIEALGRARHAQGRRRSVPAGQPLDLQHLHGRPRTGARHAHRPGGARHGRLPCPAPRPRARRQSRLLARAHRHDDPAVHADKLWVRQIKSALMENRFRLVQQPVASLLGDRREMFDVLLRMLDEDNNEVLPSDFIPVAERHDLMKNIDRWVIGASMRFCATRQPDGLFVRLSGASVGDASLPAWLTNLLKEVRSIPRRSSSRSARKPPASRSRRRPPCSRSCASSASASQWKASARAATRSNWSATCAPTSSRSTAA